MAPYSLLVFMRYHCSKRDRRGRGLSDWYQSAREYMNPIKGVQAIATNAANAIKAPIAAVASHFGYEDPFNTNSFKTSVQALLRQIGSHPVTAITVGRVPLAGALDTALKYLSAGKWDEVKKTQGIDNFFHLFSILTVGGGQYLLEKNANINLQAYTGQPAPESSVQIAISTPMPLEAMLKRTQAAMGDDRFFTYNAFSNNCQDFMIAFLGSNSLLTSATQSFVKQDSAMLQREIPSFTQGLASMATDLGHIVGAGVEEPREMTRYEPERRVGGPTTTNPATRCRGTGAWKQPSAWKQHVAQTRHRHPHLSLKEALQHASRSYKNQATSW